MTTDRTVVALVPALGLLGAVQEGVQGPNSRCADCHFANPGPRWQGIKQVKDQARRARLEGEMDLALVPLIEAVQSANMFVFEQMQERLEVARKRVGLLLEEMANPKPPSGK